MDKLCCYVLLLLSFLCFHLDLSWSLNTGCNQAVNSGGSPDPDKLEYHMGPVLASPLKLYIIWYGNWNQTHQDTIRDFLSSFSSPAPRPSVADWWSTVRLYTDQTGSNVTDSITLSGELGSTGTAIPCRFKYPKRFRHGYATGTAECNIAGEFFDTKLSHGPRLNRMSIQAVIKNAVTSQPKPLPLDPRNGYYLVLTSADIMVDEFCRAVCAFHYFTFPATVGVIVPYAWVGYSGTQCPGMCAYPFAWPMGVPPPPGGNGGSTVMRPPNGDIGVDGMISVIAHELAESATNPLVNAWYAGNNPTAPGEIADLCLGVYGSGGGGAYVGQVSTDAAGNGYNLNGIKGRRFMVQWVWDLVKKRCFGPNAKD
ncbi:EXORDIUM LIKE 7 [Hibiscus trionum]|uniref:EXORDIUM LIKE 7 n=1 Tax=Hibiscus trionum TaxID=183268 RepID=A0A9W7HSZ3_HIBTR|nr:EXORDIUM LIKE 7 [Hibiscus trionum]